MSQGFEQSQIQYLMVFLRDAPSNGLEEFESQFINFASFQPAVSGPTRLYRDCFGEDTKIKVLVTGEIELNEKNIFVGLKMAFPEWEFELFPMNVRKLFLKDPDRLGTNETGVVATIEPTMKMDKVQWGKPCIFDLSQKYTGVDFNSILDDSFPNEPKFGTFDVPQLEEQLENFKDIWTRDVYENESDPIDNDVSDIADITEKSIETSLNELFKKIPLNDPEPLEFSHAPEPEPDPFPSDNVTGADSEEILDQFGGRKSFWPFTDSFEAETNDPSFMGGDFSNKVLFDDLDLSENSIQEEAFLNRDAPQENFLSHADFEGTKHEFEMLGVVQETPADDLRKSLDFGEAIGNQESVKNKFSDKGRDLFFNLLIKIKELPTKKISTPLLILGIILIALSYGVKIIEPDYDASRKAAGIIDVYEWIIANDMLGEETADVFEAWDNSEESIQFWAWFDSDWSPKILLFNSIEGGLRKVGAVLAICGILVFTTIILASTISVGAEEDNAQVNFGEDKRISLNFTIYNDAWPLVDTWGKEYKFKIIEVDGLRRLYRKSGNLSHPPILCMITCSESQVQLEVWMTTWIPTILIPVLSDLGIDAIEAKNAVLPTEIKEQLNVLLSRLGHPPIA